MSFGGNMFEHVKNGLNTPFRLQKPFDFTAEPSLSRSLGHRRAHLSAITSLFKALVHDESCQRINFVCIEYDSSSQIPGYADS